jgi:hypothetical protein
MRLYYLKVTALLPPHVVYRLESLPFHPFRRQYHRRVQRALQAGPPYRPSYRSIVIDITTACNLKCVDCNRSCGSGQAPSDERMSPEQIEKFIRECVDRNKHFEEIDLEGGEPTLHPQLHDIVSLILNYRDRWAHRTEVKVMTNGHGPEVAEALSRLPRARVDIQNSRKSSSVNHCPFNVAPCDVEEFRGQALPHGCYLVELYGLGLTRHGYYPHPICAGIDRVFGFDLGRKSLPLPDDQLDDQLAKLCRLCGFYHHSLRLRSGGDAPRGFDIKRGWQSASWRTAYENYREQRPPLSEY